MLFVLADGLAQRWESVASDSRRVGRVRVWARVMIRLMMLGTSSPRHSTDAQTVERREAYRSFRGGEYSERSLISLPAHDAP